MEIKGKIAMDGSGGTVPVTILALTDYDNCTRNCTRAGVGPPCCRRRENRGGNGKLGFCTCVRLETHITREGGSPDVPDTAIDSLAHFNYHIALIIGMTLRAVRDALRWIRSMVGRGCDPARS